MSVECVDVGALDTLLGLPEQLYRDDPTWVSLPRFWTRRSLRAALATPEQTKIFCAKDGSRVVGTISVHRDVGPDAKPTPTQMQFGHFECVDDTAVASALLDAAAEQAQAWGAASMLGPQNSRFEFVGVTVDGFERLPPLMQGHHPRYYQRLLEAGGLRKHHDMIAYESELLDARGRPVPLPGALRRAEQRRVEGLEIRPARKWEMRRELDAIFEVFRAAYATIPDVAAMSRSSFSTFGRLMVLIARPEMTQIATLHGRPVGFAMCIPELNEAFHAARDRGRLRRAWRVLRALPNIQSAAFKLIGVIPEVRGSGIDAALLAAITRGAQAAGYQRLQGSVVDERNWLMRGVVESLGLRSYRVYRLYEKRFTP